MFDSFHHRDSVVLLQIARSRLDGSKDKWWIRLERTAGGDIAKLSHDQARIMEYGHEYEMAAEADFTEGLPFAHVLRVLDIIQEVSPNPTLIGSRLYASIQKEYTRTLGARDKHDSPSLL
ncbi:complex I intermediate-associated protein 30, mitochondrial [Ceratobasidium sp. AG-Ba]|nr:complex I intermediate-associated protein 30, mitochondrial [Ceratobasidium sp. AG-Ba]